MTAPAGGAADAAEAARVARDAVRQQIARVWVGPTETIDLLFTALLARGHVLLEGGPGIAKTTLVKAFAATLGCAMRRIQFTPDLLPADITGTTILDQRTQEFVMRQGPLFSNVVLGDEINRAPAKTQSALLEAMQELQVTVDGRSMPLSRPFIVLATQNPVEHEGVYLLPEAQLDRFMFKITLGYPTPDAERRFLAAYSKPVPDVTAVLDPVTILHLQAAAEQVYIDPELLDYIVRLAGATRAHPRVRVGASPRAGLLLMMAAKVYAFVSGRDFVLPDDIRALLPYVFAHRMLLHPEAELEGQSPDAVLSELVARLPFTTSVGAPQ
jgi:MoxR-like ATPase